MGLVDHAREELKRAGLFDEDSDYGGAVGKAVMRLIEVMAADRHSGGSAQITLAAFDRVVRGRPLTPITSDPSEWMDVADAVPGKSPGVWQNRRAFSVFSEDGGKTWYDLDGVLGPTRDAYRAAKASPQ